MALHLHSYGIAFQKEKIYINQQLKAKDPTLTFYKKYGGSVTIPKADAPLKSVKNFLQALPGDADIKAFVLIHNKTLKRVLTGTSPECVKAHSNG